MLKVTVHNAERIPNLERFTNVDPMVTLIFQGMYVHKLYNHFSADVGVNSNIKIETEYKIFLINKTKRKIMVDAKTDGICRVIVHNVINVPSTEGFLGLPDPYVDVFYHGRLILKREKNIYIFVFVLYRN
jgi:hypothetical protein